VAPPLFVIRVDFVDYLLSRDREIVGSICQGFSVETSWVDDILGADSHINVQGWSLGQVTYLPSDRQRILGDIHPSDHDLPGCGRKIRG